MNTLKLLPRLVNGPVRVEDIWSNYNIRAKQVSHSDFKWSEQLYFTNGCFWTLFSKNAESYLSIYIPHEKRGMGLFKRIQTWVNVPILNIEECNITDYLINHNIPYINIDSLINTFEYKFIERFSGHYYDMNNIDHGLYIMRKLQAGNYACRAYCLIDVFSNDNYHDYLVHLLENIEDGLEVLSLCRNYIELINQLNHNINHISQIDDVNKMFIAYNVQQQNYCNSGYSKKLMNIYLSNNQDIGIPKAKFKIPISLEINNI